jgi:DNA-binding NarL/FixJ family response regulator
MSAQGRPSTPTPAEVDPAPITVLLVDDQAVVRTGLRTILEVHDDLRVVGEAGDGNEALLLASQLDPDVVLMDIRMPGMDWIAATRTLVESGARCQVCVLTTYGVDENVYDALQVGASGFLVKTDPPEHIVTAVRALAAGDTVLGPETTRLMVRRFLTGSRPGAINDPRASTLTKREAEVLAQMADGLNNAEIARRLFIGEGTVKTHVARILAKLAVRDRLQAAVYAHHHQLADPPRQTRR